MRHCINGLVDTDIVINARISIPLSELSFQFARASGPGGQNVNRVESAVELTFDLQNSTRLSDAERERTRQKLGSLVDSSGVMHVVAQSERSQLRNRQEVVIRFAALLREALIVPKKRRKTRPTKSSVERRIESKKRDSHIKRSRSADW